MKRAHKIIAHHRGGQGKVAATALTHLHTGPLGETGGDADKFVDPLPYLSLAGNKPDRMRDPRGRTKLTGD